MAVLNSGNPKKRVRRPKPIGSRALFSRGRLISEASLPVFQRGWGRIYILTTSDETHWLPNKEVMKLSEVSDETSTNLFPHFQCQTLQCDTSTLKPRPGGSGPVA